MQDPKKIELSIRDTPPCKGCEERNPGCHGKCPKYFQWKLELARVNENKRKFYEKQNIMIKSNWRYD